MWLEKICYMKRVRKGKTKMSTYSREYNNRSGGGGLLLLLIALVVVAGLFYLGFSSINFSKGYTTNDVQDFDPEVDALELESNSARADELKVYTNTSHAEKHGSEALAIRECLDLDGADAEYQHKDSGNKRVQVCIMPNGDFGLWFFKIGSKGDWHEVTAFIKNSVTNWSELEAYLSNTGYLIP